MPTASHVRRHLTAIEDLDWFPRPTQAAYIQSDAVVNGIYSMFGGGKTWACAVKYAYHAQRNYVERGLDELEMYVIRDTLENLKRSPIPTCRDVFGSLFETFNQDKEGCIYTRPRIHLNFFGIADGGDLTKLQGPEAALIHLEEVCPIEDAERYSAGLSESVFNLSLVRCARQRSAIPCLLVSGNPGDDEHWFYRRLVEPADGPVDEDTPLITKRTYKIPYEENIHLPEIARQATRAAYKFDPQGYKRFVEGQFVPVYRGKKVVPAFNREWHVGKETLVPLRGLPAFRFWDSWGEPRCVMGQQLPNGQVRFLDVVEDHSDIRALVPKVQSRMNHPRWTQATIREWRDGGDWTMTIHDQSNKGENAAKVVEESFGSTFEVGPARWENLKICLGTAFTRATSDGSGPAVLVNPDLRELVAALNGRWHINDKTGKPVKDAASHLGDCVANAVAVLQPWQTITRDMDAYRRAREQQRRRAVGYGGGRAQYA